MINATLATLSGDKSFSFLINPELVDTSLVAVYSSLAVLGTSNAEQKLQYSQTTYTMPVKLWVNGNKTNLTPQLDTLRTLLQPKDNIGQVCTFKFGVTVLPRVFLTSMSFKVDMWDELGNPSRATGDLTLVEAPLAAKPTKDKKPNVKLSERLRASELTRVKTYLKANPSLAQRLGVTNIDALTVNEAGHILQGNTKVATVYDIPKA